MGFLAALPLLCACGLPAVNLFGSADTVGGIAFDVNSKSGYTLYVDENGVLTPYLVLTDDYGGRALLLREFVLDEPRMFNDNTGLGGYYEDSLIDTFLNGEFFDLLAPEVQELIPESLITIADRSSIGVTGVDTTGITRKVFLLSYTEIGMPESSIHPVEGEKLKYFDSGEARIARFESGEAASWWLRSADTWDYNVAAGVGPDASVGGGGVYYENGVRPAFCLDREARISERDVGDGGEPVFVLDFGNSEGS